MNGGVWIKRNKDAEKTQVTLGKMRRRKEIRYKLRMQLVKNILRGRVRGNGTRKRRESLQTENKIISPTNGNAGNRGKKWEMK